MTLPIICDAFGRDYEDSPEVMINRCIDNQQLISINYDEQKKEQRALNEYDLLKYLKKRSNNYKNVINIQELARGGEAIVYRLEYLGIDEVVIKTTQLQEKLNDPLKTQEAFIDIMSET